MTLPLNVPRARRLLAEEGVDALLATSQENVYYLSGVTSENFSILPRQTRFHVLAAADALEAPRLVAGLGEAANIWDAGAGGFPVYLVGTFYRYVSATVELNELERYVLDQLAPGRPYPSFEEATAQAIRDAGLESATVGIDERGLTQDLVERLRELVPSVRIVPAWQLFRRIRAVKSPWEQDRLRRAVAAAEQGIGAAMGVARVGVTEREMIEAYEHAILAAGARPSFAQIALGRRGGSGYVMRREAALAAGDIIRFDVGCNVDGYQSDIARNFVLEEPPARTRRIHEAMLAGEEAARVALRPGARAGDVFDAAIGAIRSAGVPDFNRHHVGHAIGLEVYDLPTLAPGVDTPIEAGMVFCLETPYYELGFGGLQPEDAVVVGEEESTYLNSLPHELTVWR